MRTATVFVSAIAFSVIFNVAYSENINLGTYIRVGDSGTLTIEKSDPNKQVFSIDSIGSNCHTCEVMGSVTKNVGKADVATTDSNEPVCLVSFSQQGDAITVDTITPEPCQNYCGARASFHGLYKKSSGSCFAEVRKKRYETANGQYKAKEFAKSEITLKNLVTECADFMSRIESDRVKNDLALSQLRQGELKACLATLDTTIAAKYKNEEHLKSQMPPCDFDNYVLVARSTWFNQALCKKKKVK